MQSVLRLIPQNDAIWLAQPSQAKKGKRYLSTGRRFFILNAVNVHVLLPTNVRHFNLGLDKVFEPFHRTRILFVLNSSPFFLYQKLADHPRDCVFIKLTRVNVLYTRACYALLLRAAKWTSISTENTTKCKPAKVSGNRS
ncbi:hypothetical protein R70211_01354 [Paraburkholderia domus]|uniref:Uncharacterized protein n=1 Tax=Paraburkholderia domus TaxID=2793075 RepID=A0A9N8MM56_9BURK|nr:hypothetical protein R70211_01354 [Paraburkholderia domus]